MTRQISDIILYGGDEYRLLDWNPGPVFHPKQFGITTETLHTGCVCGFHCTFEIRDGGLYLASLKVRATGGLYPPINDTPPSFPHGLVEGRGWSAIYTDIGLRLPYSGRLRFGTDQDHTYHVDMLGPEIWMFRRVHEAVIVDGHAQSVTDISATMARVRARKPYSATVHAEGERLRKLLADLEKPGDKSGEPQS